MTWYLWLLTGAALAVSLFLLFLAYLRLVNIRTVRHRARRQAVANRRLAAESQMQDVVQKTISEMFRATRGYQ